MTRGGSHVSPENIQAMEQILIILSGRQVMS
jgi:hypothetical protein